MYIVANIYWRDNFAQKDYFGIKEKYNTNITKKCSNKISHHDDRVFQIFHFPQVTMQCHSIRIFVTTF